jgi:hypothetical protein
MLTLITTRTLPQMGKISLLRGDGLLVTGLLFMPRLATRSFRSLRRNGYLSFHQGLTTGKTNFPGGNNTLTNSTRGCLSLLALRCDVLSSRFLGSILPIAACRSSSCASPETVLYVVTDRQAGCTTYSSWYALCCLFRLLRMGYFLPHSIVLWAKNVLAHVTFLFLRYRSTCLLCFDQYLMST